MTRPRLLQMSAVVVDLIYQVDAVPLAGDDILAKSFAITAGGGFNAMLAAKRAGVDVSYGGVLGSGPFSDLARNALAQAQINLQLTQPAAADQASCVVLVDADGERSFIYKANPNDYPSAVQLAQIEPGPDDWVLLSGYALTQPDSRQNMFSWLRELPPSTVIYFDPAPVVDKIPDTILNHLVTNARWISANRHEAFVLTGYEAPGLAAETMAARQSGAMGGAIVRDGANGCWLARAGKAALHIAGFEVATVDTNGAGDTHLGTFIAALGSGHEPIYAAQIANAAAACATTRFGSATAPALAETLAFLTARCGGLSRGVG